MHNEQNVHGDQIIIHDVSGSNKYIVYIFICIHTEILLILPKNIIRIITFGNNNDND